MCPPMESDPTFPSCSKNWATGQTSRDLEEKEGGGRATGRDGPGHGKACAKTGGVVSRMAELPVWVLARFPLQTLPAAS